MKIRTSLIPALALLAVTGLGLVATTTPAVAAPAGGARTIAITANDQMKYSVTSIEAKPGEELKVVLTNEGTLPKAAMAHNWVLLKAGSDAQAFSNTAAGAGATNYIPESLKDEILAKIDLLGPKQTGEVTFKAPTEPGTYPYLCSFPAHYAVGMKGTLTVK